MQQQLNKKIYKEFVYSNPSEHLLKPNNLTRPPISCHRKYQKSTSNDIGLNHNKFQNSSDVGSNNLSNNNINVDTQQIKIENCCENNMNINVNTTPDLQIKNQEPITPPKKTPKPQYHIYDEETFNQIELRGFITKDLLKQCLNNAKNLFHISTNIFEDLCNNYNEFVELLHTLETEFDSTIKCIKDTISEVTKKINHVIYELYVEVMNKKNN
jgi:hypothetical protein